jgi:hypothetical protein
MHWQQMPLLSQPGYVQVQLFKFFCFLHSIEEQLLSKIGIQSGEKLHCRNGCIATDGLTFLYSYTKKSPRCQPACGGPHKPSVCS